MASYESLEERWRMLNSWVIANPLLLKEWKNAVKDRDCCGVSGAEILEMDVPSEPQVACLIREGSDRHGRNWHGAWPPVDFAIAHKLQLQHFYSTKTNAKNGKLCGTFRDKILRANEPHFRSQAWKAARGLLTKKEAVVAAAEGGAEGTSNQEGEAVVAEDGPQPQAKKAEERHDLIWATQFQVMPDSLMKIVTDRVPEEFRREVSAALYDHKVNLEEMKSVFKERLRQGDISYGHTLEQKKLLEKENKKLNKKLKKEPVVEKKEEKEPAEIVDILEEEEQQQKKDDEKENDVEMEEQQQNEENESVAENKDEDPAAEQNDEELENNKEPAAEDVVVGMFAQLSNEDLREELRAKGITFGPIIPSTRKIYEKKLEEMEKEMRALRSVSSPLPTEEPIGGKYAQLSDGHIRELLKLKGIPMIGPISASTRPIYERRLEEKEEEEKAIRSSRRNTPVQTGTTGTSSSTRCSTIDETYESQATMDDPNDETFRGPEPKRSKTPEAVETEQTEQVVGEETSQAIQAAIPEKAIETTILQKEPVGGTSQGTSSKGKEPIVVHVPAPPMADCLICKDIPQEGKKKYKPVRCNGRTVDGLFCTEAGCGAYHFSCMNQDTDYFLFSGKQYLTAADKAAEVKASKEGRWVCAHCHPTRKDGEVAIEAAGRKRKA